MADFLFEFCLIDYLFAFFTFFFFYSPSEHLSHLLLPSKSIGRNRAYKVGPWLSSNWDPSTFLACSHCPFSFLTHATELRSSADQSIPQVLLVRDGFQGQHGSHSSLQSDLQAALQEATCPAQHLAERTLFIFENT